MKLDKEFAVILVPATMITSGGGVVVVKGEDEGEEERGAAFIIRAPPEEAAEIISPETVIAEPGERVCEPNMKFERESVEIV